MSKRAIIVSAASIFIVLGILIGATITGLAAHGGDPDSIHACVDKKGQVRIVEQDDDCTSLPGNSWVPLDWPANGTDTVLTEAEVEGFITNGPVDLDGASTLGGQSISTGPHAAANQDWDSLINIPAGFSDNVDNDAQLTEGQVESFVTNGALDLDPGTTLGRQGISTGPHTGRHSRWG